MTHRFGFIPNQRADGALSKTRGRRPAPLILTEETRQALVDFTHWRLTHQQFALQLGHAIKPGAADGARGASDEVFLTNLEERLRDVDLAAEEKRYDAHRIAEGGTFVVVEVDDADLEKVRSFFAEVDAQQMKTAV